jgi:murein DD-endopeptidase MepM/ murein hydrolase activator NlpD
MLKPLRLFFSLLLMSFYLNAQPVLPAEGGGGIDRGNQKPSDELTKAQREEIIALLKQNETMLRKEGKLTTTNDLSAVTLIWPIKLAAGYYDNNFYGIVNYVDENPLFPDQLKDYNCGARTYDLSSGYNHQGTDISTWPFPWQKMAQNAVQIVAGAAGTIIGKSDNNFDQNCAFCVGPCTWNAVYVMHSDGSVAWYGHMKTGSLTSKLVGQTVAQGEYLGIVGSSGNSTGPHLHIELYTNSSYTKLVDPWAGPCNALNGNTSWWANQQPYFVSTVNKIMTHSAAPGVSTCSPGESVNEKTNFINGQQIFLGGYYRDVQVGQQAIHTLYRPDNTVYSTWAQTFTTYYALSWWWYSRLLPNPAFSGTWKYEVVFNGKKHATFFAVNSSHIVVCPGGNAIITSNVTGGSYQWQVNTGNGFANVTNDNIYNGALTSELKLNHAPSSYYGYQYRCLVNGAPGIIISLKFITHWNGAVSTAWEDPLNWSCGVPDANTDVEIVNGLTKYPEVSSNAFCRSTNVAPNATLKINSGSKLTVKTP